MTPPVDMEDNSSPVSNQTADVEPPKRPVPPSLSSEAAPKPKRGKYTSVACNECKKKKLKCIPVNGSSCERCIAGGVHCVFAAVTPQSSKKKEERWVDAIPVPYHAIDSYSMREKLTDARRHSNHQMQALGDELAKLRQQVTDLSRTVDELKHQSPGARTTIASHFDVVAARSPSNTSKDNVPKHPQFVGPTRPSYGLVIAERSLTRMGIPASPSPSPSGAPSPAEPEQAEATDVEFWAECSPEEMARLLAVFEEEVESVYPFINILELAARSEQILRVIRDPSLLDEAPRDVHEPPLTWTDVRLAKLAVATGIAIEAHGKNDLCAAIAESVVAVTARISRTEVELKGIQLLMMLSIYYFHCDDELLAWRTIGIAAREALEMGLHRRRSLYDNFTDPQSRHAALRVFWCCYVLDRRWSFGTSLSFSLTDRDIDPALLEPDIDSSYLKCMVGYARLCSKLWDAIPPFGSPCQSIPPDIANALDASTQTWLESIPPHLQMRHPRAFYSTRSQPRVLHRLRAFLYLRGNLTRISIYQHHLLSAATIKADLARAKVAVDLAQDTVQVLVHLNATSDIYSRQQNAFNYFLLGAFAVISLAICHAPNVFAAGCAQSFIDAIGLVRGFSRHSIASRRLWKSIRGLLPRLKSLGLQDCDDAGDRMHSPSAAGTLGSDASSSYIVRGRASVSRADDDQVWTASGRQPGPGALTHPGLGADIPDMTELNNDILNLFDTLGQGSQFPDDFDSGLYNALDADLVGGDGLDISRRFLQGLM
ncbi:Casein kinase II, regulatory subunit [Metarhizium guizhouense ARSEF 977]|uniref:Casein kinase II, regulatory subunit n=1 Tax=Metarhizium guizhouense (strain ARSEF 977) TaxID=1276136 RepID=A0A0B4HTQ4_METGA|nr:Casein kinase II, regulatory subunit [Metarhizium guizhouense ARSEF 977]